MMPSKTATSSADKHRAEVRAQVTCHAAQEQQQERASRRELEAPRWQKALTENMTQDTAEKQCDKINSAQQEAPVMQLRASDEEGRFHPQHVGQLGQGGLLIVCCHVCHEGQVLHQATALTLRSVSWAQHTPLAWLQSARPTHLHWA